MKTVYYDFFGGKLTLEEMRMVSLTVQGYTAEQAGLKSGKSMKTVHNQLDAVYNKLGIHYSHHLIAVGLLSGFDEKGYYKGENLFEGFELKPLPKGTDVTIMDLIARQNKQAIQQNKLKSNR